MKTAIPIEQLLRWRALRAETEAPRPPRAAQLLALVRHWCEIWPERFHALVKRVSQIQIAYGHAMTEPRRPRAGHPVPTVLVSGEKESETSARVLYIAVHGGRLRLRLAL